MYNIICDFGRVPRKGGSVAPRFRPISTGRKSVKLDLRALLAGECRTLPFHFPLDVPDESNDPGSILYGVRFPSPPEASGEVVNSAGYMRLRLDLSLDFVAPCARCLADVAGTYRFTLEKTVATPEMLDGLDEDKVDDFAVVEDGFLDLSDPAYSLLLSEFPSRVLCREDCRGLCPICGTDLNEGSCSCKTSETDPRLSPLAAVLERLREEEKAKTEK